MVKKHLIHSFGTNIIILLLSLFQGVLVARTLNPEGKGAIAVYMSIFGMTYALTNLGLRQSSSYYHSKEGMSGDDILNAHFFGGVGAFLLTSACVFVFLYIQNLINIYIISCFLFMIPFSIFTTYSTSFALSYRWIDKLNKVKILTSIVTLISLLFFFLLLEIKNIEVFFISQLIASIITAIYVYSWLSQIDGITFSAKFDGKTYKICKKLIVKGLAFAFPLFVYGLNFKIDIIILNQLVNLSEIGIYSVGVTFAELIWQIPAVLSVIIFSYSVSDKKPKEFSIKLWKNCKKMMFILIPLLILYALIVHILISLLFGDNFSESYLITILLLPGTYAIIAFNTLNADLSARGFPSEALFVFSFGALINVALNYALIPHYGIHGAAFASSASYIISSCCFIKRYYDLTFKAQLK